jgi:hypothetical protein
MMRRRALALAAVLLAVALTQHTASAAELRRATQTAGVHQKASVEEATEAAAADADAAFADTAAVAVATDAAKATAKDTTMSRALVVAGLTPAATGGEFFGAMGAWFDAGTTLADPNKSGFEKGAAVTMAVVATT